MGTIKVARQNMTTDLEFLDIHHRYSGHKALSGLDLRVEAGEIVCLLGPSGCGKTTALRIAAGLEKPERGEMRVKGRPISSRRVHLAPEERNIGLVFQDFALFPHLSVAENVGFGLAGPDRHTRIAAALEQVGLAELADKYPHELSGGQQQRAALARACAPGPDILLMDEPFSGLDAGLRDRLRDRTLHFLKRTGMTTLMVTHDAEEAMYMSDRIAVMRDGCVVQAGLPDTLYHAPKDAFVAGFFGEVNRISGAVQDGGVETPLGRFGTGALPDGTAVEIVLRPEALHLEPAHNASFGPGFAKVLNARMLGRSSLVHLCTCRTTGEEMHLHARMPGRYLPGEDDLQRISVNHAMGFVFPAT